MDANEALNLAKRIWPNAKRYTLPMAGIGCADDLRKQMPQCLNPSTPWDGYLTEEAWAGNDNPEFASTRGAYGNYYNTEAWIEQEPDFEEYDEVVLYRWSTTDTAGCLAESRRWARGLGAVLVPKGYYDKYDISRVTRSPLTPEEGGPPYDECYFCRVAGCRFRVVAYRSRALDDGRDDYDLGGA